MQTTLDTRYNQMQSSNDYDWQSDESDEAIAAAAQRHGVSAEDVERQLESYIPDADTPRESIDRAAGIVADKS